MGKARSLTPTSKTRKLLRGIASCVARDASCEITSQYAILNTHDQYSQGIPLAGNVAAGLPVEAIENCRCLSLESCFGNRGDNFALEVRGDSMIGENIHQGDYVICRKTSSASNGQLVVAIVDNDNATLKRFFKEGNRVRLQPANEAYEPIYSDNCRIEGIVIGLVRKL